MKKQKIEKKVHFFFGKSKKNAKLSFKLHSSNILITLLDLKNKVVCCKTSGCSTFCINKKRKKSTQAIDYIVDLLMPFLKNYNIKNLIIIFKCMPNKFCFRLINYLLIKGIKVVKSKVLLRYPHNGVRNRKVRRI